MTPRTLAILFFVIVAGIPTFAGAQVREGHEPKFNVTTLDGQKLSTETLRGKVVLVDMWATWCAPCRESFPFYERLARKYAERDFVIVAISVDEEESVVRKFLQEHPVSFEVVFDAGHRLAEQFTPPTMPTSFLFDRRGQVREIHEGFDADDRDEIEASIKRLLAESREH